MSELQAIIADMGSAAEGFAPKNKQVLLKLVTTLTGKMEAQSEEIRQMRDYYCDSAYGTIAAQLDAVEKRTDHAADAIMSAAEELLTLAGSGSLSAKDSPALLEKVNAIFEACTFQDLVAQHVHEVRQVADALKSEFSAEGMALGSKGSIRSSVKARDKRPDRALLNGPSPHI